MSNRYTMVRIQFRWRLPIWHFLVDCAALALLIWQTQTLFNKATAHAFARPATAPVLFVQEADAPGWDFHYDYPPPSAFVFLDVGNPVAMVVSALARPEAYVPIHRRLWDPWWFLIYESVALPIWFLVGMWAESGQAGLRQTMNSYLILRICCLPFLAIEATARIGQILELLFWLAFVAYAIWRTIAWTRRKLTRHP